MLLLRLLRLRVSLNIWLIRVMVMLLLLLLLLLLQHRQSWLKAKGRAGGSPVGRHGPYMYPNPRLQAPHAVIQPFYIRLYNYRSNFMSRILMQRGGNR
jgi:hypothetical protein